MSIVMFSNKTNAVTLGKVKVNITIQLQNCKSTSQCPNLTDTILVKYVPHEMLKQLFHLFADTLTSVDRAQVRGHKNSYKQQPQ